MKNMLQLTIDLYVNQNGDVCTRSNNIVLAKPLLEVALSLMSVQELCKKIGISTETIETLINVLEISQCSNFKKTPSMYEVVFRHYILNYDELPSGIYVDEYGELVASTKNIILTKPFLQIALKYRSEEELANQLNIPVGIIEIVKCVLRINMNENERLTKERIKIMEIIQRYHEKYGVIPPLSYIRRRSKYTIQFIKEQIKILVSQKYLKYEDDEHSLMVLRAV